MSKDRWVSVFYRWGRSREQDYTKNIERENGRQDEEQRQGNVS